MKKKFVFVAILIVSFVFILLWKLNSEQSTDIVTVESKNTSEENAPETTPAVASEETQSNQINPLSEVKSAEDEFAESLSQCLDLNTFVPIKTPEELVQMLKALRTQQTILVENYHLELPNREERRLHLIANENGDSSQGRELRYFKLDSDGLPQKINLKPKESLNPSNEMIAKLLKQGQVTYHQSKENWKLNDESILDVEYQNEKIYEFQYQVQGKIFSCRELECQCSGM